MTIQWHLQSSFLKLHIYQLQTKCKTWFFLPILPKGGWSHLIQKGFISEKPIFWHFLPKRGVLSKKLGIFWPFFAKREGGSRPIQKILIRKNWGGQILNGGRGGLRILTKRKKIPVFLLMPPLTPYFAPWCTLVVEICTNWLIDIDLTCTRSY